MNMFIYYFIASLTFLAVLEGCSTYPVLTVEALKGPAIQVQHDKLAQNPPAACAKIQPLQILPRFDQNAVKKSGLLPEDFFSLQQTADTENITFTVRDVNPSCAPYLQAGFPSKSHDVLSKTFTAESLPPEYHYLAGTVSTLMEKPHPGEKVADPLTKRYFTKDGNILTCDYDLADIAKADGQRVVGESSEDLQLRQTLNASLPWRGQPPQPVMRFMHGAQAEYSNYLRAMAKQGQPEPLVNDYNRPEAPLTAFVYNGAVYRLPELEDVLNFYQCYHIALPPEWNLH